MKRKVFLFLLLGVFLGLMLTGCGKSTKKAITSGTFEKRAKKLHMTVKDYTGAASVTKVGLKSIVTAQGNKNHCYAEFYEFKTAKDAKAQYKILITQYQDEMSGLDDYEANMVSLKNGSVMDLLSKTDIARITRVDSTLLLVKSDKTHQKDMNEFVELLGY